MQNGILNNLLMRTRQSYKPLGAKITNYNFSKYTIYVILNNQCRLEKYTFIGLQQFNSNKQ